MIGEKNKGVYNRSSTTKRSIIRSAIHLAADKSIDSVTFSDIARLTGLARSTIYTYFSDVDALMVATSQRLWHAYRLEIALMSRKFEDSAFKVALPIYYFLTQASEDPVFAWFMVRNRMISAETSVLLHSDMKQILQEGIWAKRFHLHEDEIPAVITLLRGAVILASQNVLAGTSRFESEAQVIKLCLRTLGLSREEAKRISEAKLMADQVKDRRITRRLIYA